MRIDVKSHMPSQEGGLSVTRTFFLGFRVSTEGEFGESGESWFSAKVQTGKQPTGGDLQEASLMRAAIASAMRIPLDDVSVSFE